jgi:hypothetical protein
MRQNIILLYLEVGNDLLDKSSSLLLKLRNTVRVGCLELGLDSLHVTLDVGHVRLLVEGSLSETERVDDVVNSLGSRLGTLIGFFSRGVSANVNITLSDSDHLE